MESLGSGSAMRFHSAALSTNLVLVMPSGSKMRSFMN